MELQNSPGTEVEERLQVCRVDVRDGVAWALIPILNIFIQFILPIPKPLGGEDRIRWVFAK